MLVIALVALCSISSVVGAIQPNVTGFYQRRDAHIDHVLQNQKPTGSSLVYEAKRGIPLNMANLKAMVAGLIDRETADFDIVKLVRIMYYTSDYDDYILPTLRKIPLWFTEGETVRCYWSENHMIMWTSSAFLIQQKHPSWSVDAYMRQRLVAYLNAKIEHGFYEFFSNIYFRFTLSGLLNLVDFAQDPEIQQKALAATTRFLKELLIVSHSQNRYTAAQGRSHPERFLSDTDNIVQLLIGDDIVKSCGQDTIFLSTTSMDLSDILGSWRPNVDTVLQMGHDYRQTKEVFKALPKQERIVFQFSYGGYFHPDLARDTVWLIHHYKMEKHHAWHVLSKVPNFLRWIVGLGAKIAAPFTRSSVLTGTKVAVYRNGPSALSSAQDYNGGYAGWQQAPWTASTGRLGVFTLTGPGKNSLGKYNQNTHLPKVFQKGNVALIMYRQNNMLRFVGKLGFIDLDPAVHLFWKNDEFDEMISVGNWKVARENNGYVAVYQHCGQSECRLHGQTWAVVVGNSETHGSFDQFKSVIQKATVEQKWYRKKWYSISYRYFGKVAVDGVSISHHWK